MSLRLLAGERGSEAGAPSRTLSFPASLTSSLPPFFTYPRVVHVAEGRRRELEGGPLVLQLGRALVALQEAFHVHVHALVALAAVVVVVEGRLPRPVLANVRREVDVVEVLGQVALVQPVRLALEVAAQRPQLARVAVRRALSIRQSSKQSVGRSVGWFVHKFMD